ACQYKYAVRFGDTVCVKMKMEEFNGLKFRISYNVTDKETGEIRLTAETSHFFVDSSFKPIRVKHLRPDIYNVFKNSVGVQLYDE
ncbi:MAG: acyl-CoA thioesterase, partial [Ruminococcaceae bacterium]|nr:acyl-CoA thioesterase [Oscillospiraceae bacterium]